MSSLRIGDNGNGIHSYTESPVATDPTQIR